MQKKLYIFIGALILIVLFLGFASAGSCDVVERNSCTGNIIMGLSDYTNAHGELASEEIYSYVLCCDFEGTHECTGSNKIIGLSDVINAHAQIPNLTNYETPVCYDDLECRNTIEECSSYEMEMLSLSGETNAHIGGFNDYDVKICCRDRGITVYDYEIELEDGWNLISIPLVPNSTTIGDVLDGIKENLDIIWAYKYDEVTKKNEWYYKYYSDGWKGSSDFIEIVPGYGYFILMKEDDILYGMEKESYLIGSPVPSVDLATESWNLIGRFGASPVHLNWEIALKSLRKPFYNKDYVSSDLGIYKLISVNTNGDISWNVATTIDLAKGYWVRTAEKEVGKETNLLRYEPDSI